MSLTKKQGQFDRAGWRIWILAPFWFLQVSLLMGSVGIFAYRLAETFKLLRDENTKSSVPTIRLIWEIVSIAFSFSSLVLNTIEIARYVAESLTPFTMVFTHAVKLAQAASMLGLDITVYLQKIEGPFTTVGLIIDCVLIFCILVPFIYTITVYRRLLRYSAYHHPANVKAYGFSTPAAVSSSSSQPYLSPFNDWSPTGGAGGEGGNIELGNSTVAYSDYQPPPQTGGRARAKSAASSIISISSLSSLKPSGTTTSKAGRRVSTESMSTTADTVSIMTTTEESGGGARETYSHERSTEFEKYVNRMSLKEGVDAAVAAEFGWNSSRQTSGEVQQQNQMLSPSMIRSDSLVGSGTVGAARTRPSPDVVSMAGRAVSWGSARGLVSVPEDEEEGQYDYCGENSSVGTSSGQNSRNGSTKSVRSEAAAAAAQEVVPVDTTTNERRKRRMRAVSEASDRQGLLETMDVGERSMMYQGEEEYGRYDDGEGGVRDGDGSGGKRRWEP